ncbi:MAG: hypothetical protein IKC64_04875 [Clostridia bacterium]|nr:hypothetical protein [Clostridia bacterium]
MARKKAKKTIDTTALMFIGIAVVGLILAILGLCLPWITSANGNVADGIFSVLFDDLQSSCTDANFEIYSFGLVRTFGIISLVLAIAATALIVLKTLGIFELKGLIKLIIAVAVVVVAVLLLVFAISYISSLNAIFDKNIVGAGIRALYGFGDAPASMGVASFFLPIGTAMTGVAYLLNK